jgi:hypothetical protein
MHQVVVQQVGVHKIDAPAEYRCASVGKGSELGSLALALGREPE